MNLPPNSTRQPSNSRLYGAQEGTAHDLNFYGKQGASVQSGQGGDNNLTNLEEEDDEDLEAQLQMLGKPG